MKYLFAFILISSIFCANQGLVAQETEMSRREYRAKEKALKDSAREYYWNLERFEQLLHAREIYQAENDSLRQAYQELLDELSRLQGLEDETRRLSLENNKLNNELNALHRNQAQKEVISTPPPKPALLDKVPDQGTYFTIQVGAYTYNNYSGIAQKAKGETVIVEKANGLNKYLIGLFENYEDAYQLKNKLLQIGLPEAWIVVYKDGVRVPMSSVRTTQSGS